MSVTNHTPGAHEKPREKRSGPPLWLLIVLGVLILSVIIFATTRAGSDSGRAAAPETDPAAEVTASAAPDPAETAAPEAEPTPELPASEPPAPEVSSAPAMDYGVPLPESAPVDMESWFSDAVFIGDSRTDGFHLYSGIKGGDYLIYNGITTFDIMEGKKVIRDGDTKITVLEALARKQYGKVYLGLGVNELGYYSPTSFKDTYSQLIDAVRECQPNARIYIQTLIPVNTAKCEANDIPEYVTNEAIAGHNQVIAELAAEKQLLLVDVAEALVDETGEVPREDSADGVHFKKTGYEKWLAYLLTHTGT